MTFDSLLLPREDDVSLQAAQLRPKSRHSYFDGSNRCGSPLPNCCSPLEDDELLKHILHSPAPNPPFSPMGTSVLGELDAMSPIPLNTTVAEFAFAAGVAGTDALPQATGVAGTRAPPHADAPPVRESDASASLKRNFHDALSCSVSPLPPPRKRVMVQCPRMFPQAAVNRVIGMHFRGVHNRHDYAEFANYIASDNVKESIAFQAASFLSSYAGVCRCAGKLCDCPCQVLPDGTQTTKCRGCNNGKKDDGTDIAIHPKEANDRQQYLAKYIKKDEMDNLQSALNRLFKDPSTTKFLKLRDKLQKHCFESDGVFNSLGVKHVIEEEVNRKQDQVCSRELIGFNFCPVLIKSFADCLGLKEKEHYVIRDVESLMNKVVLFDNSKLSFDQSSEKGKEGDLFGGNYWQIFWATRFFLDLIESALAFALIDPLISLLMCEALSGTSNKVLLEIWSASGYLLSTLSRLAVQRAKELALATVVRDQDMSTPDRTKPGPLIVATKLRFLKELLPATCSTGFVPTVSCSDESRQTSFEFVNLISGMAVKKTKTGASAYYQQLFNGIDMLDNRILDVIAESVCKVVWSESENRLHNFPACLAACVGMILKAVVFNNGKGGPFKRALVKDTRSGSDTKTKKERVIKFCDGYHKNSSGGVAPVANSKPVGSIDDFQLVRPEVMCDIGVIWANIFDTATMVRRATSVGACPVDTALSVDEGAIFSLNASPTTDLLYGGTTAAEKKMLTEWWLVQIGMQPQCFKNLCCTRTLSALQTAALAVGTIVSQKSNDFSADGIRDTVAMDISGFKSTSPVREGGDTVDISVVSN